MLLSFFQFTFVVNLHILKTLLPHLLLPLKLFRLIKDDIVLDMSILISLLNSLIMFKIFP